MIILASSFRGGTGKSTIVSNLASYLALFGKKVIVVDADITSPGIHAIFGFGSQSFDVTLTDYLLGESEIDEALYDISEAAHAEEGTLLFVPASIAKGDITDVLAKRQTIERLVRGLQDLEKKYRPDHIFVDTHPGINDALLLAASKADILINVLRPDAQDYQGGLVFSALAKKLAGDVQIVFNRVPSQMDPKTLAKKVSQSKIRIAGYLPFSEKLMLAESQQIFVITNPLDPFSKAIQTLAHSLLDVRPREHIQTIYDVLEALRKTGGADYQRFRRTCGLSDKVCMDIMKELIEDGYVEAEGSTYTLSSKGKTYLAKFKIIKTFIENFRL